MKAKGSPHTIFTLILGLSIFFLIGDLSAMDKPKTYKYKFSVLKGNPPEIIIKEMRIKDIKDFTHSLFPDEDPKELDSSWKKGRYYFIPKTAISVEDYTSAMSIAFPKDESLKVVSKTNRNYYTGDLNNAEYIVLHDYKEEYGYPLENYFPLEVTQQISKAGSTLFYTTQFFLPPNYSIRFYTNDAGEVLGVLLKKWRNYNSPIFNFPW